MTALELDAVAAKLTLADVVELNRRVLVGTYPEITSAAIVATLGVDDDPLTLPLVRQMSANV